MFTNKSEEVVLTQGRTFPTIEVNADSSLNIKYKNKSGEVKEFITNLKRESGHSNTAHLDVLGGSGDVDFTLTKL